MEAGLGGALERALARARQRTRSGDTDWERTATAWEEVQQLARTESQDDVVLEGALSAVDAWRRADRPERVLAVVEETEPFSLPPEVEALLWAHGSLC